MNVNALRAQMIIRDVKASELAGELGISKTAMYRKLKGDSDFTRGQVEKIIIFLNIENPLEIFFNLKVS